MLSGRITKLPVSWYWSKSISFTGPHKVSFRAVCSGADTRRGRCDTGMLVYSGVRTAYNNDDPDPATHGTGSGAGSYVSMPVSNGAGYTVVVFSQLRATSRTYVEYSMNNGAGWVRLSGAGNVEVGGTVVKVGALHDGDSIEVQTRAHGADEDETRMLLFSPDGVATKPVKPSTHTSAANGDPRIMIANRDWLTPDNYVLIGKTTRSSSSMAGVETRVDLVHSPLSVELPASRVDCPGGCPLNLEPGRYSLYVFATIDMPVGHYTSDPRTQHLSGHMPMHKITWDAAGTPKLDPSCPSDASDGYGDATWYRGTPNDIAMTLSIQRRYADVWKTVRTRKIPRGAFGAGPSQGWNKFSLDLDAETAGVYRIVTSNEVDGVRVFDEWRAERNPEATEIKAVTYNVLYNSHSFDLEKYRNIANLLGTRGSILPATQRVEELPEQGPFEWEADVLGLQEVEKGYDGNRPDNKYTNFIHEELDARSSLKWVFAQGRGETFYGGGLLDGPGMSPILLNSNVAPTNAQGGPFFNLFAKSYAGCTLVAPFTQVPVNPEYMECHLEEQGMGSGEIKNYATAARLSAWRGGDDDRP
jgi:hypothetical protein